MFRSFRLLEFGAGVRIGKHATQKSLVKEDEHSANTTNTTVATTALFRHRQSATRQSALDDDRLLATTLTCPS